MFLVLTCKVLFAASYAIQVLSYRDASSLTPAFMKMIERSGLTHQKFYENGYNKIVIGSFKTETDAIRAFGQLSCLPNDAFIRKLPEVEVPKVESVADDKVTQPKTLSCPACAPCQVVCDPKEAHKMEIAKAIEYYKNSSFYRFSN